MKKNKEKKYTFTEEDLLSVLTYAMLFVRNQEEYNRPHLTNNDIELKAATVLLSLKETKDENN